MAATLDEQARPTLWLRLGPEDADPATLLLSLIGAARRLAPDIGAASLDKMRLRPGPVMGWVPLFVSLGRELAEGLPPTTALVIDRVEHIAETRLTLDLLGAHLLPALADTTACILVANASIHDDSWPSYLVHGGIHDLRVEAPATPELAAGDAPGWHVHRLRRAVALTEGRADVLAGLAAVRDDAEAALVQHAIDHATDFDDLLRRTAHAWLSVECADAVESLSLALAARLGYSHPLLVRAALGGAGIPACPFLQPLEADWSCVRRVWASPLRAALRTGGVSPGYANLRRMADFLASHDALEQAVPIYTEIGDTAGATEALAKAAETMINLGQWQTLRNWLDGLAGQSSLSDGRQGALSLAILRSRLLGALGLHRQAGEEAAPVERYAPARQKAFVNLTEMIRGALAALSERGLSAPSGELLPGDTPALKAPLMPSWDGWPDQTGPPIQPVASGLEVTPPVEAPPAPCPPAELEPALEIPLAEYGQPVAPEEAFPSRRPNQPEPAYAPAEVEAPPTASSPLEESVPALNIFPAEPGPEAVTETPDENLASPPVTAAAPGQTLAVTAHLLGAFRVSINDRAVENWPGGRGQSVFKYLLLHHGQPVLRDVLMDTFWPDASPDVVRNRLHVALYSLRQKLRTVTSEPVVVFEEGAYALASNLSLWLDVDEFSRHVEKGGRLEKAEHLAKAAAEFELAVNLYQGDLLADDPYEEWPVVMREHLRVAYLDTLDRLSHIYFDRGDYAACSAMGQLILARDNCREDTHCLLMCCYARQGQHHLALRQYQACVEALKAELDTSPEPATTELYERIRRGKPG